jgi:hypothetical protein
LVSLLLLLSFGLALGINIYRGADISSGCFGLAGTRDSLHIALLQDLFLLAVACILTFVRQNSFSLDRFLSRNNINPFFSIHRESNLT